MTEIRGLFKDSNFEIREGLHRMLGTCCLSTKSCIKMSIQALLDNLKRYPQVKFHSLVKFLFFPRHCFEDETILRSYLGQKIHLADSAAARLSSSESDSALGPRIAGYPPLFRYA